MARRTLRKQDNIEKMKNLYAQRGYSDIEMAELLGIAGLVGAGRTELLECIFGATRPSHGRVLLDGKRVKIHSPADAVRIGIGLVPEERRSSGLVLDRSVAHNISFPILNRVSRLALVSFQKLMGVAQDFANRLNIRTPSLHQRVRNLSGGNQQKVVLAKWLLVQAEVLILDEPTRGVDVATKVEIYHIIRDLADQGIAILLISSEMPEILGMSDRILVMREGRVAGEFDREQATEVGLLALAAVGSQVA